METYYLVNLFFLKERLKGNAMCGYVVLHPQAVNKQSEC